jgi:sialic acid synthase SpsE
MSLEPKEFKDMVKEIREVEKVLGKGKGIKHFMQSELNTRAVARKSVVALVDIKKGTRLKREMLGIRRPGLGIQPSELDRLIDREIDRDVPAGSSLYPEWLIE